jgi:hypothetical protein
MEATANAIANAADLATTKWNTIRGVRELPFPNGSSNLIGSRPGIGRYAVMYVPLEIGETLLAKQLEKSPRRLTRFLGHILINGPTVAHAAGAIRNLRIPTPKLQ